jgi:DNA invertase Pin-like site-specific DNA recombinase
VRAAEYVRMSNDHQKYSTLNQSAANHAYATDHGMVVVRTYADEGKSGVSINGRDALKALIAQIQSGDADFDVILVYDVSRWGRLRSGHRDSGILFSRLVLSMRRLLKLSPLP